MQTHITLKSTSEQNGGRIKMGMRKIYRKVARKNGVSVKEVKREMQKTIVDAWGNTPNDGGMTQAYQRQVPCRGEVPTPNELIRYVAAKVQNEEP